jgi:hypothetical protein
MCKYASEATELAGSVAGLRADTISRHRTAKRDKTMADTETPIKKPAKAPRTKVAAPAAPNVEMKNGDATPANGSGTPSKGVIGKAKETTSKLASEAVTAARHAANEGKDRASDALNGVSKAVEGAASLVEDKVGPAYGNYARKAADQVSGFAQTLQSKDIDDLIDDTRNFVRKQPMVAIGAAAAIGFVLTRLIKIGGSDRDA